MRPSLDPTPLAPGREGSKPEVYSMSSKHQFSEFKITLFHPRIHRRSSLALVSVCSLSGHSFSLSAVASKEQYNRLLECGHDSVSTPSSSATRPNPMLTKRTRFLQMKRLFQVMSLLLDRLRQAERRPVNPKPKWKTYGPCESRCAYGKCCACTSTSSSSSGCPFVCARCAPSNDSMAMD